MGVRRQFEEPGLYDAWATKWRARLSKEAESPERARRMRARNPAYIPRNHRVEEVLAHAREGELAPFEKFMTVLATPYVERDEYDEYTEPAAKDAAPYRTFCGT